MTKVIVSCYDKVAEKLNEPFCADNFEVAKRMVRQALAQNPGLQAMAADLELRQLCTLDFVTGKTVEDPSLMPSPVCLVDLLKNVAITGDDLNK